MIKGFQPKEFIDFFTDSVSLELEHDCYLMNYTNKDQVPLMICKKTAKDMLRNTEADLSLHYFLQHNAVETEEQMNMLQALDTSLRIKKSDGSTRFINPGEFVCPLTREIVCEWDLVDLNNVFAIAAFKSVKQGFKNEDLNKILNANAYILKKGERLLSQIQKRGKEAVLLPLEISTLERFGIVLVHQDVLEMDIEKEEQPSKKRLLEEEELMLDIDGKYQQNVLDADLALAMSLAEEEEGDQTAILEQFALKRAKVEKLLPEDEQSEPAPKKKLKNKQGSN